VAALCVAALTAIAAVVTGGFDDTDGRVIGSSLGFAVFSATAASGASLRFRQSPGLRALGLATIVLSLASFLLLLAVLWTDGDDPVLRWFGSVGLATLACSHASLVSAAFRPTDSRTIRGLGRCSIALAALDASFGILATSGALDNVDEGFGELVAVLVILLLLTTALPPILRRLQRPAGAAGPGAAAPASTLVDELLAVADRIDALNAAPGDNSPQIQRECERLRELARSRA
jgi:hypothetical protein